MASDSVPPVPMGQQLIESPKITDIHSLVADEQDCERIAKKMLKGTFEEVSYEEYANLLGNKEMSGTLRAFVGMLGPLPESLLSTLQLLVSKLHFVAEAQNIDRILEELSQRWVECHPDTFWEDHYKLCHIVLFSLLILNSDLHNSDGVSGHAKFSLQEFVENTIYALKKEAKATGYTLEEVEPMIAEQLGSFYDKLKAKSLPLASRPAGIYREASRPQSILNTKSSSFSRQRFSVRSVTSASLETTLSNGASVHSGSSSQRGRKESNYTSNWKFHHNKQLPQLYNPEDFDAEWNSRNNSLWFMDSVIKLCENGLVSTKDEDESAESLLAEEQRRRAPKRFFKWLTKSKPRSIFEDVKSPIAFLDGNAKWIRTRVRVSEGRIFVFKLKSSNLAKVDANQDLDALKENCSQYFVRNLFEAVATLVQDNVIQGNQPDSAHLAKEHLRGNFTVVVPSGPNGQSTTLEFQTATVEEAANFVHSINFWAARITSVPSAQFEVVSNQEYGWSEKVMSSEMDQEYLDKVNLSVWRPLLSIEALYDELQTLGEQPNFRDRLEELTEFTQQIEGRIDLHNSRKPVIVATWTKSAQFEAAMDNWNNKYLYLHEISGRNSKYLKAMQMADRVLKEINQ
ncbi:hypothetical protein HG536_0B05600 [Torulaspora globosa]|uniref:Guanine-nucleotide exchange factor YEL1 n=1 Tax=Torulaspora globosa TaxID=48254 RepID=A0A7G3ZDV9_9SACH|nr:uncharacterized protein HG536_0B05600 [Torulaspora globosa]QLL31695.1 hypothetical protein HG536_0B05600 [Torulaspora globosa]